MTVSELQDLVWDYYAQHARDLPWRHEPFDAYQILVSELMLQQTQVSRVIPKYQAFIKLFPTIKQLAEASLAEVLIAWSGLGYNRRAKYLHQAAKQLETHFEPWTLTDLTACKGIGNNTAGAVLTYAYNSPNPFIETNIRTVMIHHLFSERENIDDKELLPVVHQLIDQQHPREFMWAMMDYGSFLKANHGNSARFSKHHTKQSKFEGSWRQLRGQVIKQLTIHPRSVHSLQTYITDVRLPEVLRQLEAEQLIQKYEENYQLVI